MRIVIPVKKMQVNAETWQLEIELKNEIIFDEDFDPEMKVSMRIGGGKGGVITKPIEKPKRVQREPKAYPRRGESPEVFLRRRQGLYEKAGMPLSPYKGHNEKVREFLDRIGAEA